MTLPLSNSSRDSLTPVSQGKTWLDPAWDIHLIFAQARNCSFGYSEQTGQHPNNSAVVINATRTRILHSLYSFLNLREEKKKSVWKWTMPYHVTGRTDCLNMQFPELVKNDAELGPNFNDLTPPFSTCLSCSFTYSAQTWASR